jgi:hypothetical protein
VLDEVLKSGQPRLKPLFLVLAIAVLVSTTHSHVQEHQVPHPQSENVSLLTKQVVPPPQLSVASVAVSVTTSEHLITIGLVATPTALALIETEQFSPCLRGPPLV